ncbi:hypothetical protein Dsin_014133 [Dipteronia sinensis]|uniref:Uncharacterized protein n=1 Tax=Dipteronia sinensis TaxID=43782 RepID=A0AAE0E9J5_9ROSI|nr:hypothetical protein Dsin_014133 [Dipteronia sinensis]
MYTGKEHICSYYLEWSVLGISLSLMKRTGQMLLELLCHRFIRTSNLASSELAILGLADSMPLKLRRDFFSFSKAIYSGYGFIGPKNDIMRNYAATLNYFDYGKFNVAHE